jgi:phosphoglycolate phosphatase
VIRGALLDLDGTLLDTAPDLAAAANRMLAALGRPSRRPEEVATYVGKGLARLVERCLTGELQGRADPQLLERAVGLFSPAYEEQSGRHCRVFDGVLEGLDMLQKLDLRLACVTNKPERFTLPLLQRMGLGAYFDAVVCADRLARTKPDPLPFLHACKLLEVRPQEALVVGDSANDVQAARAADIPVVCVAYGYTEGRAVDSLGADLVIADLPALGKLLGREPSAFDKHR